jgi:hypothetical protein
VLKLRVIFRDIALHSLAFEVAGRVFVCFSDALKLIVEFSSLAMLKRYNLYFLEFLAYLNAFGLFKWVTPLGYLNELAAKRLLDTAERLAGDALFTALYEFLQLIHLIFLGVRV